MNEPARKPTPETYVLDDWERAAIEQLRTFKRQGAYGCVRIEVANGAVTRILIERSIKSPSER